MPPRPAGGSRPAPAPTWLHLLDPATGTVAPLVEGPGQEYEPAWSPDSGRVVTGQDVFP
ncbi:hypothetical protein [Actinoplanes sp. NPDC049265]|uniref:hypothetical protein n=1 Tax=Actinoplanes sp. NPDC049265 TaxID=3363902 RepID=UPI00371BC8BD